MSDLATLLVPMTRAQIATRLRQLIEARGRISGFRVGGATQDVIDTVATIAEDLIVELAPSIAAGGLIRYACGVVGDRASEGWAELCAREVYDRPRVAATHTIGNLVAATADGAGPYTLAAGELVTAPSGNRYAVVEETVLDAGPSSTTFEVQSEHPNDSAGGLDYSDPSNYDWTFVTPLPGVAVSNPSLVFSSVTRRGSGTGTITLDGAPVDAHEVTIRVDTAGNVATATGSYSLDGAAYVSHGALADVLTVEGAEVTFVDGAGSPSFHVGDTLSFSWPGTWITTPGHDVEPLADLATACLARWPRLAVVTDPSTGQVLPVAPTLTALESLAIEAGQYVADGAVTRARAYTSETIPQLATVYVAGQGGILPAAIVSAVQSWLERYAALTDRVLVSSPSARTITLAGGVTIVCRAAQLTAAQETLQARLQIYFGGQWINPLLQHADVVTIIKAVPGVLRLNDVDLTINGTADDLQLPVTANAIELPVWSQSVTSAFTWSTE